MSQRSTVNIRSSQGRNQGIVQVNNNESVCFRCQRRTAPRGLMCSRCCQPLRLMCLDQSNIISKMIIDSIWNSRADRREALVKKVVENYFEAFKELKQDNVNLKKALKDLKDLELAFQATKSAKHRLGFKQKIKEKKVHNLKQKYTQALKKSMYLIPSQQESVQTRLKAQKKSDYEQVKKLLCNDLITKELDDLYEIAQANAGPFMKGDRYEPCCNVCCDGVEFRMGRIDYLTAKQSSTVLLQYINNQTININFTGAVFRHAQAETYVWLSMHSDHSTIDSNFLKNLEIVRRAVREHVRTHLKQPEFVSNQIDVSKLDTTIDLKGSFMPSDRIKCEKKIQGIIKEKIMGIYAWKHTEYPKSMEVPNLRVCLGDNRLDTCFQYQIKDVSGGKLLNIKIYDKFLDLIGRDGYQIIGSRFDRVIGAKREYSSLLKRTKECQYTGMTRLEVSLCLDALEFYNPFSRDVMAGWHDKVWKFMASLQEDILNNPAITANVYRRLSLPHLLGELSLSKVNLLLIGNENTWIVNARTAHKEHFVGTKQAVGLTAKAQNTKKWLRIADFALRYAASGSTIKIFNLHSQTGKPTQVAEVTKDRGSPFQPPGCSVNSVSVIRLPQGVEVCIKRENIFLSALQDWSSVIAAFCNGVDFKPSSIDVEMEESVLDITVPGSKFIRGDKSN